MPESILQELEEAHREEIPGLEWSRVTSPFEECGRVLICRTNNAVEMAHEYAKSHTKEEVKLPE
jgi:NurA-like 5'-3' nuclease